MRGLSSASAAIHQRLSSPLTEWRFSLRFPRAQHGACRAQEFFFSALRWPPRGGSAAVRKPGQVPLMRQTGRCGMRAICATGGWGRSARIPARSSPERTRQFAHERGGMDASLGTDCRGVYWEGVGCAKLADDERPSPRDVMASAGTPCAAIRSPPLRRRPATDHLRRTPAAGTNAASGFGVR